MTILLLMLIVLISELIAYAIVCECQNAINNIEIVIRPALNVLYSPVFKI